MVLRAANPVQKTKLLGVSSTGRHQCQTKTTSHGATKTLDTRKDRCDENGNGWKWKWMGLSVDVFAKTRRCRKGKPHSRGRKGGCSSITTGTGASTGTGATSLIFRRSSRGSNLPGRRPIPRYTMPMVMMVMTMVTCTGMMYRGLMTPAAGGHGFGTEERSSLVARRPVMMRKGTPVVYAMPHNDPVQLYNGDGVRVGVVAPLEQQGPLNTVTWKEILEHMRDRLQWESVAYELHMFDPKDADLVALYNMDAVIAFHIYNHDDVERMKRLLVKDTSGIGKTAVENYGNTDDGIRPHTLSTWMAIDCDEELMALNRILNTPIHTNYPDWIERLMSIFSKKREEKMQAAKVMEELYQRKSSDDLLYSFLVLIHSAVRPVGVIQSSTKRSDAGLPELQCMVTKCGREIFQCVTDPVCKQALDCLNSCSFNDQVCSYRCIASYESPQLQQFSLCILQKHNCLGLDASIPSTPTPKPMARFRGDVMTEDIAKKIFIGWLDDAGSDVAVDAPREDFSWRVFAGKNAAYDYFPCQFQLFFPGKAKNTMWYQPVFKVKTLDGREVWRERLYRVRPMQTPGTFRFSVLDNGVTSLENWSILDCAEDLSWCAFHYHGAAAKAGISYSGAILASKSGAWPTDDASLHRIQTALDGAGIKMWELSSVDNSNCNPGNYLQRQLV